MAMWEHQPGQWAAYSYIPDILGPYNMMGLDLAPMAYMDCGEKNPLIQPSKATQSVQEIEKGMLVIIAHIWRTENKSDN